MSLLSASRLAVAINNRCTLSSVYDQNAELLEAVIKPRNLADYKRKTDFYVEMFSDAIRRRCDIMKRNTAV
jgi:hypothetical protein